MSDELTPNATSSSFHFSLPDVSAHSVDVCLKTVDEFRRRVGQGVQLKL